MICRLLLEDVVVEDKEDRVDFRTGASQRLAEVELASTIGREVFDQQAARSSCEDTFDLRIAPEALANRGSI